MDLTKIDISSSNKVDKLTKSLFLYTISLSRHEQVCLMINKVTFQEMGEVSLKT